MHVPPQHQVFLLNLARQTIRGVLRGQTPPAPAPTADALLSTPAGCFVSLHERASHRLRGCVGRIQSDLPLVQTIHAASISVLDDPRFADCRIRFEELGLLELEISVLSPLVAAAHPLDFEPLEDGIFLHCQGHCGTFLPQVARQTGWTREQLLARLCTEKMGLPPHSWRNPESSRLLKYRVAVLGPTPFNAQVGAEPAFSAEPQPLRNVGFGSGNVFRI